jgi:ribose transport system ATP-binding protein
MQTTLIDMRGLKKQFPGVQALTGVDLTIKQGEVHGLSGETGAGKSVLLKVLLGAYNKDEGEIYIKGNLARIEKPADAQAYGISAVYQEIMLAPHLSVAENISLGNPPGFGIFFDQKELCKRAEKILNEIDDTIDIREKVVNLAIAKKQMVAIGKALYLNAGTLILDEPTAILTGEETEVLFNVVKRLKNAGVSVIYVSHRLEEVFEICDSVTILRNGEKVGDFATEELTRAKMISMMAGREVSETFVQEGEDARKIGSPVLTVKDLSSEASFENISFNVCQGEIVGFFGLVGAGRTEVMRAIFGADSHESGLIEMNGRQVHINSVIDSMKAGIGLVPEDRRNQGVAVRMAVVDNINMAFYQNVSKNGFVSKAKEKEIASDYVDRLKIRTPGVDQVTGFLSGGNMQKVAIAKWLNKHPSLMIFDEPTVGIDVGAKYEIYTLLHKFAQEGTAIIFVSSYLAELMGTCDRIIVMCNGRITGEFNKSDFEEEKILNYAFMTEQTMEN